MTANLRTAIKQKITPFIKSFVASDMYELDSTMDVKGQQVSRFKLFLNALEIDDKTQEDTKGLYAETKRAIYGAMVTDFIKANSEAKTKGTKANPSTKKEDNIGRRKLFEIMKKYILKNPNDPRFNLVEQPQEDQLEPELEDAPTLAQADAKDQLQSTVIPEVKVNNYPTMRNIVGNIVDKTFGLAESKRLLSEKKKETKAQTRKTVTNKIKLYKKQLDDEAIAEAKAIAQSKREEKARKAQEKKRVFSVGTSDILRAQQPVPQRVPEEKKQTVFNMGLSELLASAPSVATRVAPPFTVIPPLVSTPAPVPAPQAEAILQAEQPQEVKQRPRPNMSGLLKRQQERKEQRQVKEAMGRMRTAQPRTREQFIAEQEQQFVQAGLDVDADEKQQLREDRLEKELEQAQEVQLPLARMTMGQRVAYELGGITFSALASVLFRRGISTGNSQLIDYASFMGGILGSAVYRSAITQFPQILNNVIKEANNLYQTNPDDIIEEYNKPEPLKEITPLAPAQGPAQRQQRSVEDIKGEGKYESKDVYSADLKAGSFDFLDSKSTPEQIDNFRISQGLPPVNRGPMARLRGLGGAGLAYAQDAVARKYNEVKSSLDPQRYDEQGKPTKYDINGNLLNPVYPNEEVFLDGNIYIDAKEFEGQRPSRIREAIDRSKRVLRTTAGNLNDMDPLDMTDKERQIMNVARSRNAIISGASIAGAGILGGMNKQQSRIKENPLVFKQEQTSQGDGETNIERGAGKLKPKFIVPSANIFNKTEQEQYVDDIEFAMFDFVQDEGGNDPYGTNPLLRDQQITDGLRYQRSGVNVYSLYGANLPDNPKNMPIKKMQEMFLGENRLPEMKFLFSNEFEAQEFNQSEFEVDEYDVNNERTAIEAYSPYANFTNNQLLDQFYDTSILYGVVP